MLKKEAVGKRSGRKVVIVEGNLPDKTVCEFLATIDAWGQRKMRHKPEQSRERQYFTLYQEGSEYKIVGYGAMYPRNEREANWGITLHQDWRGEGIGKAMYEFAEELCRKYKVYILRGEVDADNEITLGIFKKMNYELYGPIYKVKKEIPQPDREDKLEPPKIDSSYDIKI